MSLKSKFISCFYSHGREKLIFWLNYNYPNDKFTPSQGKFIHLILGKIIWSIFERIFVYFFLLLGNYREKTTKKVRYFELEPKIRENREFSWMKIDCKHPKRWGMTKEIPFRVCHTEILNSIFNPSYFLVYWINSWADALELLYIPEVWMRDIDDMKCGSVWYEIFIRTHSDTYRIFSFPYQMAFLSTGD